MTYHILYSKDFGATWLEYDTRALIDLEWVKKELAYARTRGPLRFRKYLYRFIQNE
jgi:hypothetical protein